MLDGQRNSHTGSLSRMIDDRAGLTPDATMVVDERGADLTHAQYRDACDALADRFAAVGVRSGDVVTWQLPTWITTMIVTGALARLGAVQNPLLPTWRAREVRSIVSQVDSQWYIHPGTWRGTDFAELAEAVVDARAGGCGVLRIGRDAHDVFVERPGAVRAASTDAGGRPGPDRERWIFTTSGTTDRPKGVRHGHDAVAAATASMCTAMDIGPDDMSVVAFPLAHIGGVNWLMAALSTGCRVLLIEHFAAPDTMDVIARHPITLAGVTTAFHLAYLNEQRARGSERLLPHVRVYPGGAAPKPPELSSDLAREVGGVGIVSGFGLTEFPMITMGSIDDPPERLAHTEGRASAGVEIRIVTTAGRVAGPDEIGEVRARGPHRMLGYVDPAMDDGAFDADGFFRTGDLGRLDAAGYLTITGRLKDVIVRKGENISAHEVEHLVFEHPDVADVAVIGLPDPARGELVAAVVVPRSGREVSLASVTDHLRSRQVMPQKMPEALYVVDELPRNAAGKVDKQLLRDGCSRGAITPR